MAIDEWETPSIGSDESGKGDFFGAPSVAAVKLDEKTLETLKKQSFYKKIKDSKNCSDEWIMQITPKIIKLCQYKCVSITPKEYNDLYQKYKNVNVIIAEMHNKAHSCISGEEIRILDAFVEENNYEKYIEQTNAEYTKIHSFCQKADSKYLSVALASIIARYHFILQINDLSVKSGVKIPYGNSYKQPNSVISAYKKLISKGYKISEIDNCFVKNNFSTLKKIKETYL